MKLRFELGEKVTWAVPDHTFRLIYGLNPMEIVDMYYQHAIPTPNNGLQRKFQEAGFWPLFMDHGLVYTVRFWPDGFARAYDKDRMYLKQGQNYGETLVHEKWLKKWEGK